MAGSFTNDSVHDPITRLRSLAESRSYRDGVDLCFSMLDESEADRGFWTLQIALLYFLNFWERGELFEEAPRFAEKAARLSPDDADTRFWFGHISEVAFRDIAVARREYEAALRLRPDHALALLGLAETTPPADALPLIEAALALQPGNYRALMMLADVHAKLGDEDAAALALSTLLDRAAYEEHGESIMDRYINTELNHSYLDERIATEAQRRLAAMRRQKG